MAASSTIILLNGTGSAGKTSIARELQGLLVEPYLHLGMDVFYEQVCPPKYLFRVLEPGEVPRPDAPEAVLFLPAEGDGAAGTAIVVPEFGRRLISGMHRTVATLAAAGDDMIVDHVLWIPEWLRECVALWAQHRVLFVGVHCPLPELERREWARPERSAKGVVRWQFARVHAHGRYDLEVDTATATPRECAQRIIACLHAGPPPTAFADLARRFAAE
ncbi:MAG TPA: AAA family ATPase [Thermomicrobiales bacterium]|nr:AAA family ATPase [Thermomicrobiales bacterium]